MNIKITYQWLLEYLDTDANPYEIQKYLSISGPSVERIEKKGDDFVFDIEITSNRVDGASVFGIAQECQAILPRFKKKARIKKNPLINYTFPPVAPTHITKPLHITIQDATLCLRVSAIVLSHRVVGQLPEFMRKRLEWCDIRSINALVDVSNYLMLSLGQPTHVFDYDMIADATVHIRRSKGGETVTTLDGEKVTLPGDDIVITDGKSHIDAVAGIMGAQESAVTQKTRHSILFIENYHKRYIRNTSMRTGKRTMAATYFEKGLDPERTEATLAYGVELLVTYADASVASPVYDIYPHPYIPTNISISLSKIRELIGVEISSTEMVQILEDLDFKVKKKDQDKLNVTIPSYRTDDVSISEDIVEEIARIYGYHRLPSYIIPTIPIHQSPKENKQFSYEAKVKYLLTHLGLNEMYNYSMISEKDLTRLDLSPDTHFKIKNAITNDLEYMRSSLIPSLLNNVHSNQAKKDSLVFFELSRVYEKSTKEELPREKKMLGIVSNTDFFDLKGIVETLFNSLRVGKIEFRPVPQEKKCFYRTSATLKIKGETIGTIGILAPLYQSRFHLKKPVYIGEIDFEKLIKYTSLFSSYIPPHPYALIKLDLTFTQKEGVYFAHIESLIKKLKDIHRVTLLTHIELMSQYRHKLTLRCYFSSPSHNILQEEAQKELGIIQRELESL